MPLSEFLRMARGKLESSQQKNDVVSGSDDDLVELVWENGQIVMQGQSSKITRSPTRNSNTSRATNSRFGKFEGVESMLNDMAPVVPSGELDLSHDDEMVPWLSYPMDDSLGQDYVSTLISDVTGNGMSNQSSLLSGDKRSSCNNPGSNALRYGAQDVVSNNTCNNPATMKMDRQQQNIRPPSNFLNFSHFSRPSNLVKGKSDASGSSGAGKMETSPEKSRFNSTPKDVVVVVVNTPKGGSPPERMESLCLETSSIKNDNSRKGVPDGERIVEPIVASSSVGSGNSGDRVSCEQTHNSKRKFRDIDESDCRSDDVDTESLDAKKPNHVRGSKRGRAAEVHNLSERRRRDRINEKMRALQELIPNCNKADKASMLDEAIEYLKTLQLQVQMMSMGAGLCMPPMMFPTGMQHIHPAHFPQMGFGMGMMDMNGVSSGYPMFPVPHYPPPPVSGVPNFQRIPVFGHPGQNSVPGGPFGPVTSAMGMGMNASNTSSIENPGDPLTPMHSHSKGNAEVSCSINHKSNQATTEVLDQSASIQDNKNATGHTTLTSATKSEISKEPGDHNKSPLG